MLLTAMSTEFLALAFLSALNPDCWRWICC